MPIMANITNNRNGGKIMNKEFIEMIWGIISMISLVGIGFVFGVAGAYAKYLGACTKMISEMGDAMKPLLEMYRKMMKDEIDD